MCDRHMAQRACKQLCTKLTLTLAVLAADMHVCVDACVIPGCQSPQSHWRWTQLQAGGSPLGQTKAVALGPAQGCRRAAPFPALSPASGTALPASVSSLLTPASSSAPYRHSRCK